MRSPEPARARQPSLFGVGASDPTPADLNGLLAGPAELSRMGGTARVSVRVDGAWRVHVLTAELAARGLDPTWASDVDGWFEVRTAFTTRLVALARAWSGERGSSDAPAGLHLNGPALRLWVAAAGAPSSDGYLLRLSAGDQPRWPAVGAALSAAGLAAALLAPAPGLGDPPAYRITGRRRLARLAELVGDPPPAAPAGAWPSGMLPMSR